MILTLDAESTRLMRKDAPADDPGQPWLVAFAADLSTDDGETVDFISRHVRLPEGASVQEGAQAVHGASTRQARRAGCTQRWALYGLLEMLNEASVAVSYGTFDRELGASIIERVAGAAKENWLRNWNRPGLQWVNLMPVCAPFCKLKSDHPSGSHKWPSLDEALAAFAMPPRPTPHSAWADAQATKSIFMNLRARGALEAVA